MKSFLKIRKIERLYEEVKNNLEHLENNVITAILVQK